MVRKHSKRKLEDWISLCRERGLRKTRALDGLLGILMTAERPLTLADLHLRVKNVCPCDKATVYRCLLRLEMAGVVRRLGLHERSAYFVLLDPSTHNDYLICTECGSIAPLSIDCPVHQLEEAISRQSGFTRLYHELEFFGVCPRCQPATHRAGS